VNDLRQLRGLAERFGVPGIDLSEVVILTEHLDLIPREVCETHRILPVLVRGEHVFLAMENPKDTRVIDEIEFVTGKKVYVYVALAHGLAETIAAAHDAKERRAGYYLGPNVSEGRLRELGIDAKGKAKSGPGDAKTAPERVSAAMAAVAAPIVTPLIPPPMDARRDPDESSTDLDASSREVSTVAPLPSSETDLRGSGGRSGSLANKLILVVDDEDEIRAMLKRVLTTQGHRVIVADTGPLALQMVKQHLPDLIVLDAMLPGLHGFDVARRLKGSDRYGAIPIIMISAVYRGWRVAEDMKSSYGISDYLEKPFRLADVVDAATRALSARTETEESPAPDLDLLSDGAAKALDEGIAAYRGGDIDRAIRLLQSGTKLDPLAYRLHYHLALLYGKKDQVFDGIGELEIAIELKPKHFPALKNLALLYERAGFKNRAVEMWERCVHAAPDAANRAQVKERLLLLL
jgi:DNA-binding response OmpR family regulator